MGAWLVLFRLPGPDRRYQPSDAQKGLQEGATGPGRTFPGAPASGGCREQRRHRLRVPGRIDGDGEVSANEYIRE